MNRHDEDDLLRALAALPEADVDPRRAREVLGRATRALARQRRAARVLAAAGRFYSGLFEPAAAGLLSVGVLASAVAQAARILQVGIGVWR